MDEVLLLIEDLTKGVDHKIKLDSNQKNILNSYVLAFMTLASQEELLGKKLSELCLDNLDSKWNNLFEVTE